MKSNYLCLTNEKLDRQVSYLYNLRLFSKLSLKFIAPTSTETLMHCTDK